MMEETDTRSIHVHPPLYLNSEGKTTYCDNNLILLPTTYFNMSKVRFLPFVTSIAPFNTIVMSSFSATFSVNSSVTPSTASSIILFVTATPPFRAPSHLLSLPSPLVSPQSLLAAHPHHPLNHCPGTFSINPSIPTPSNPRSPPSSSTLHLRSIRPMNYSMAKSTCRTIHSLHSPSANRSIIPSTVPI